VHKIANPEVSAGRCHDSDDVVVVVTRRRVLVNDGRTYGEGDTLRLPLEDVASLEEHGIVTRPSQPPRRADRG